MSKFEMVGRVLEEVFQKSHQGKYEIKLWGKPAGGGLQKKHRMEPEGADREALDRSQVDPGFLISKPRSEFIEKNKM